MTPNETHTYACVCVCVREREAYVRVKSKTHFFWLMSQIWVTRIYLSTARVRTRTRHQNTPTHPLTLSHTHAHTQTRTQAHRREMGDVRAHGAIYTNTWLHVYLAKYPACCAALDLQLRCRGHTMSTRATCPKFLVWCAAQLWCTTASQGTCRIGWARPPASRKGTHNLRRSSLGGRAHTAPNEREPLMHGNFRSTS
jgi:hypothetical protein